MSDLFANSGSSGTDRGAQLAGWGDLASIADFTGPTGAALVNQGAGAQQDAINIFEALASGNPAVAGKVLAPEIAATQGQESQKLNTNNQFGNRSGGTNSSNQQAQTSAQSSIQGMIDSLIASSATELGNLGTARLSGGTSLENTAANAAGTESGQAGNARTGDQQIEIGAAGQILDALSAVAGEL